MIDKSQSREPNPSILSRKKLSTSSHFKSSKNTRPDHPSRAEQSDRIDGGAKAKIDLVCEKPKQSPLYSTRLENRTNDNRQNTTPSTAFVKRHPHPDHMLHGRQIDAAR
jgi:hypothetical protein